MSRVEKACRVCGVWKPLSQYYAASNRDGHLHKCKVCVRKAVNRRRVTDPTFKEKERRKSAAYRKTDAYKAWRLKHRSDPETRVTDLLASARCVAKHSGRRMTLTKAWLRRRLAPGKCEVTGIPFDLHSVATYGRRHPWSPSLDRIKCGGDYTPRNTRVVCVIYNFARSDFSDVDVLRCASALVRKQRNSQKGK